MTIEQELADLAPQKETALTIGVFDGVHKGHRHLIETLIAKAREKGLLSGVVTFHPHPQAVLHSPPLANGPCLMNLADRVREIRQLGVELIAPLSFTPEVAKLSAQQFASLLREYLKMRGLVIGPDFALGKGRQGNAEKLAALGKEMGFFVHNVPPFTVNNEVVSSTLVRQTLARGDMTRVKELMGRPFSITARVVSGDRRGRTLEFPTANFAATEQQMLPPNGVYASITHINGKRFASATNIGIRPTFGDGEKTVETSVIDYHGELYGKELKVEFIQKLREEQRFASPKELKAQIERDIDQARTILTGELK